MLKCFNCGGPNIVEVNAKCSDMCVVEKADEDILLEGYVPRNIGIGSGDYIDFDYCLDCGQIQDDWPKEFLNFKE
jgi:hypothetical protein